MTDKNTFRNIVIAIVGIGSIGAIIWVLIWSNNSDKKTPSRSPSAGSSTDVSGSNTDVSGSTTNNPSNTNNSTTNNPSNTNNSTTFSIKHSSGKCIHPEGGSADLGNGTKLELYDGCDGVDYLGFELTSNGSLKHKKSGKCIHPSGGAENPENGTKLVLYEGCGDIDRLKFTFT